MMQEDEKRKSDEMVGRGLDRMDRRILRALQQDGGLSNQDLAAQVGLSPVASVLGSIRQVSGQG